MSREFTKSVFPHLELHDLVNIVLYEVTYCKKISIPLLPALCQTPGVNWFCHLLVTVLHASAGTLMTNFRSRMIHDDVIKWKHFPRDWPFLRGIHRSPVNSLHKGQWRGALMFSLICAWINGWVNNREAGDLRRHRGHYDVTVMYKDGITVLKIRTACHARDLWRLARSCKQSRLLSP